MNNLKMSRDKITFNILGYTFLTILSFACILPLYLIIIGSFTDNAWVVNHGFSLWPAKISTEAYITAFKVPMQIINAYKTSTIVTIFGTLILLTITSMTGYVLARKDYKYRNIISFYFFFTTIFNGGLVPWYILCIQYLQFKRYPLLAMICPMLFNYFYVIIVRSFMSNIPDSISESAKIDGANDFTIFIRLILPLSKPVLATIGLFAALAYWNDWYNAMLFVNKETYYPLQYYLYTTLNNMNALANISASANIKIQNLPTETFKLAMTIITTGPIILVYPFVQKYFIKGMTVGAVKG